MADDPSSDDITVLGLYFEDKRAKTTSVPEVDLAAVGKYLCHRGNSWSSVPAFAYCHRPKPQYNEHSP